MKHYLQQGWQRHLPALFYVYRRLIKLPLGHKFRNSEPIRPDRAIRNPVRSPACGATGLAYERRST